MQVTSKKTFVFVITNLSLKHACARARTHNVLCKLLAFFREPDSTT